MKLIIGLGNPGKKYEFTRHNVGFLTVDYLLNRLETSIVKTSSKFNSQIIEVMMKDEKLIFLKPLTYMNLSGEAVRPVLDWYKISIEDMLVIYDDLDLPIGKIRLREKGSSGGHNGMKSIIQHVGTDNFKRIRVGIDHPERESVVDYVLTKFSREEAELIAEKVNLISNAVMEWTEGTDFKKIMSIYNK